MSLENVNDRTIVQVNSEETLDVEPACLIWRVRHETKAKSYACDFPTCSIPQTSFTIVTRLKGNDRVNLMCHLQQLFPFFSGHDPNFTVS